MLIQSCHVQSFVLKNLVGGTITFKQVVNKLNVLLLEAASKAKDGSSTGSIVKLTDKEISDVVNCYFRDVQRDNSDAQFALGM